MRGDSDEAGVPGHHRRDRDRRPGLQGAAEDGLTAARGGTKLETKDYALLAAEAASDKKASDIVVLDVAELLVVTDYFIVATGSNDRQVKVIAEEIEKKLKENGLPAIGREGEREAQWILLDFGDVVAHVFQPAERDFYRLEKLWGGAPRLALPESVTGQLPAAAERAEAEAQAQAEASAHPS